MESTRNHFDGRPSSWVVTDYLVSKGTERSGTSCSSRLSTPFFRVPSVVIGRSFFLCIPKVWISPSVVRRRWIFVVERLSSSTVAPFVFVFHESSVLRDLEHLVSSLFCLFFSMSSTKFRSSLDIRSFSMELTVSSLDLHFSVRLSFFATNQMFHEVWNHFLDVGNVVDRRVWFIRVISSCASSRNGILKATKKTSVIIRATCCFQSVSLFHVRLLATLDLIGLFFFQSHPSPSSSRKRCSFYRLSFLRRNREREREREREPSTKNRRPRTGTARLELLLLLFNCFFLVFQLPYPPESKKKENHSATFLSQILFFYFFIIFFFWSCPFPLLFCIPLHPRPLCPFSFFSILFFFVPDVSRYLAGWENAQFKFFVSYTQKKGPPINKMAPYFVSFSSGIVRVSFVFSIFLFFFFCLELFWRISAVVNGFAVSSSSIFLCIFFFRLLLCRRWREVADFRRPASIFRLSFSFLCRVSFAGIFPGSSQNSFVGKSRVECQWPVMNRKWTRRNIKVFVLFAEPLAEIVFFWNRFTTAAATP